MIAHLELTVVLEDLFTVLGNHARIRNLFLDIGRITRQSHEMLSTRKLKLSRKVHLRHTEGSGVVASELVVEMSGRGGDKALFIEVLFFVINPLIISITREQGLIVGRIRRHMQGLYSIQDFAVIFQYGRLRRLNGSGR
jgi:hypothetical protein